MEKLFDDTSFIVNKRPLEITEQQRESMFITLANQVIKYNYSNDDVETIAYDLSQLSKHDDGFERAKDLEQDGIGDYTFNGDLVNWLDQMDCEERSILTENVKLWVKAHNPLPKFEIGDELIINSRLNSEMPTGLVIYITNFRMEEALYTVSANKEQQGGYLIPFEYVEGKCSKQ